MTCTLSLPNFQDLEVSAVEGALLATLGTQLANGSIAPFGYPANLTRAFILGIASASLADQTLGESNGDIAANALGAAAALGVGLAFAPTIPGVLAASLIGAGVSSLVTFGAGCLFDKALGSPLVLDLSNNGLDLIRTSESPIMFNMENDGYLVHTGWIEASDGFLALDKNSDGLITSTDELFGNDTGSGFADGFAALAFYDDTVNGGNGDGAITSADAIFNDLTVWQDLNGNGMSEDGELNSLASYNITSISLNDIADGQTNSGHLISSNASFLMNGQTSTISDVWFTVDRFNTTFLQNGTNIDLSEVINLPYLKGHGFAHDLWVAATEDSTLFDMVEDLTAFNFTNFDFDAFASDVQDILFRWADVENINPTSRGNYIDARILEALEVIVGRDFTEQGGNPLYNTADALTLEWNKYVNTTAVKLLIGIVYQPATESVLTVANTALAELEGGADFEDIIVEDYADMFVDLWNSSATTIANHPAYNLVSHLSYNYNMDRIDGISTDFSADFAAQIDDIESEEPSTSGEKFTYWNDLLPFINAVADDLHVTDADYITALTGTYLDVLTSEPLDVLRNGTILVGSDGNDTLTGSTAANYLVGGAGDDLLKGSDGGNHSGNDIYQYYLGDGNDTIEDTEISSGDADRILFGPGIVLNDLTFTRDGADLHIALAQGGSVTIDEQFGSSWHEIENLQFDDGSFYSAEQIRAALLVPTSGNDTIVGYETGDTLAGGTGDDLLKGSGGGNHSGNDTYVYYLGDGNDTIEDVDISSDDSDTLLFGSSIVANQLFFSRTGNDLKIDLPDGGSILVENQFNSNGWYEIEQIEFENDSTVIVAGDIQGIINNGGMVPGQSSGNPIPGTNNAETLVGTSGADSITALAGNDDIYAYEGNDTISSGAGADYIELGAGNDVILLTLADSSNANGVDYVGDFVQSEDKLDVSAMGYTDVSEFSIYQDSGYTEIYDSGNGFAIGFDSGTLVLTNTDFIFTGSGAPNNDPTLANPIADQNATEGSAFNFQFAANTFDDADVGDNLSYSATLASGGALPSWLSFNAGTRTFSGTPLDADTGTISVKVTADDGHGGTPATDIFDIAVADINNAPTVANAIADKNATEDTAFSFQFAGNVFADADDGDTLTYSAALNGGGALPSWLSFNASTRTFSGTPGTGDIGTISVKVTADDGHSGTVDDVFDLTVSADSGPTFENTITGSSGGDVLSGTVDNDLMSGLGGADDIYGDDGNDSMDGGGGADTIYGGLGDDTLIGAGGVDELGGDEGNDLIDGGNGADNMFGWTGNDTLIGGAGGDYLEGNGGVDIFKYLALGDSSASQTDYIGDFVHGTDKIDLTGLGFTGIQSGAASGTVLGYTFGGGYTEISNAAGTFFIGFDGNLTFDSGDFIFS